MANATQSRLRLFETVTPVIDRMARTIADTDWSRPETGIGPGYEEITYLGNR